MTEPKHRDEAEELVAPFRIDSCDWTDYPETELTNRIATALSSRDREIREVLEGLRGCKGNGRCWCDPMFPNIEACHEPACLAARGLWEKVNLTESG